MKQIPNSDELEINRDAKGGADKIDINKDELVMTLK